MESDTIGIEITLPSREALSEFWLRIEQISHIYVEMKSLRDVPKRLQCPNHVDVQCRVGKFSTNKDRAVGLINYVDGGATYSCSGTLLSDTVAETFIPYFLTANHCVSTGTVARTVEARWFHQRASCGSTRIDSRHATTYGGADLLATRVPQDSTLLRFRRSLPGGLLFSIWSIDPVRLQTRVYGIHHPDGGVKKYSEGVVLVRRDQEICEDFKRRTGCFTVRNGIGVQWSDGATEVGSSGSGLFRGAHLVGTLAGGRGCGAASDDSDEEQGDVYGPFSDFFPHVRALIEFRFPTSPRVQFIVPVAVELVAV